MSNNPGKLIIFEGTDGAGKSTQIKMLANYLRSKGLDVIASFEPTNGPYGQKIRQLYTDRNKVTRNEELELFLADRREHVNKLINPAISAGKIVLCDRYYLSTAAYQGALGFDVEEILQRNSFAPTPDLALLLQIPVEDGRRRITSSRGEETNDFEKAEMLEKVSTIFNSLSFPYIRHINACQSIDNVQRDIIMQVKQLLKMA
ncbi:dTMP kinase [Desulfotalea psychrophila]|uniref:Thymidylate kinase n=1 Tax=Desulfotalea psychrophila (strain LSv54 / DSM 12343) TaxID=177439 RepID=KTHY_DESPS|nr:dTMP kinase [Desulfotalea psychrophila]Q6AJE2.1 RecName: Full=Thymidylate kinase; AltName: Full=dTMP kinase [Desulfotalea psychrophila LSv54]CAG37538.1 related to thymidylate kinase [Desulfotalea psychrophila LSv54]